jgi:hypothetical protein
VLPFLSLSGPHTYNHFDPERPQKRELRLPTVEFMTRMAVSKSRGVHNSSEIELEMTDPFAIPPLRQFTVGLGMDPGRIETYVECNVIVVCVGVRTEDDPKDRE